MPSTPAPEQAAPAGVLFRPRVERGTGLAGNCVGCLREGRTTPMATLTALRRRPGLKDNGYVVHTGFGLCARCRRQALAAGTLPRPASITEVERAKRLVRRLIDAGVKQTVAGLAAHHALTCDNRVAARPLADGVYLVIDVDAAAPLLPRITGRP